MTERDQETDWSGVSIKADDKLLEEFYARPDWPEIFMARRPQPYDDSARIRNVQLMLAGGDDMRRDRELMRKLLLEIEAHDDPLYTKGLTHRSPHEDRLVYYHLRLLSDEGMLEEMGEKGGLFRMTSRGHDLVEATRDDGNWQRLKKLTGGAKDISMSILRDLAMGIARDQITKATGISL